MVAMVQVAEEHALSVLAARASGAVRAGDVVTSDGLAFSVTCGVDEHGDPDAVRELVRRRVHQAITAPVRLPDGDVALVDLRAVSVDVSVRRSSDGDRGVGLRRLGDAERFAVLAAHDLKSPLCTMGVLADLLDRRAHDDLDAQAQEWLAHLRAGVRRMGDLVDGLLAYCGAAEAPWDDGPVDLGAVVRGVVELLSAEVVRTGGEIFVGPLPVVRGDERLLGLVVQNLIGNALKFVPNGSRPEVRVTASAVGDRWRIDVDDTGIGVPEQHRERIFEVFQQVRGPERYEGTGIGLSTAARIVERHGGRVWVEDAPGGRGARFTFTLPAWG